MKDILLKFWQKCKLFILTMTISNMVVLLTLTLLTLAGFSPLLHLAELEFPINFLLREQEEFPKTDNMVVFVDIDEQSLIHAGGIQPGSKTPRKLQAALLEKVRKGGAAVVLLDFDYRDESPDDHLLREAVKKPGGYIIVPRVVKSSPLIECEKQNNAKYAIWPYQSRTVLDDLVDNKIVYAAHTIVEYSYSRLSGMCNYLDASSPETSLVEKLPSAPLLALALVRNSMGQSKIRELLRESPTLERINFRASDKMMEWPNQMSMAYRRMPATSVMETDWPFNNAIVIISASHSGSDDVHSTYKGEMPGGLVVSNAILQLQVERIKSLSHCQSFLLDSLFVVLQSIVIGIVYAMFSLPKGSIKHLEEHQLAAKRVVWCIINTVINILRLISVMFILFWFIVIIYKWSTTTFFKANSFAFLIPILFALLDLLFEFKAELSDQLSNVFLPKGKH